MKNRKLASFLAVASMLAVASASLVRADEVAPEPTGQTIVAYDFETPAQTKRWGLRAVTASDAYQGSHAMKIVSRGWVFAPDKFEIDPQATYEVSAMLKVPAGQKLSRILLSTRFYDAQDRELEPSSVKIIPDSLTTLARDAKKGDASILVANMREGVKIDAIAFDAKEDLSDLPNHAIARVAVDRARREPEIVKEAGGYRITLRKPLEKDYAAGTLVRAHGYQDYVNQASPATHEWTRCSFEINGVTEAGKPVRQRFWQGTRQMRIAIFLGVGVPGNEMEVLIDEVKLVKLSDADTP